MFLEKLLKDALGTENINIKIRDMSNAERILAALKNDGMDSIQIVTDFDQTLTKTQIGGTNDSTFGVLGLNSLLSQNFKSKFIETFLKYHKIEVDPIMSTDEKIPLMLEWYQRILQLMQEEGITKSLLYEMTETTNPEFREQVKETFEMLKESEVPVLIMSAGISSILETVLRKETLFSSNVQLISNELVFNEEGGLEDILPPIIHPFSKNERALGLNQPYFLEISKRRNGILLGDCIGDSHMADGMPNPGEILKIGFLDTEVESRLDLFMTHFDIVLCNNQPWKLVLDILSQIGNDKTHQ